MKRRAKLKAKAILAVSATVAVYMFCLNIEGNYKVTGEIIETGTEISIEDSRGIAWSVPQELLEREVQKGQEVELTINSNGSDSDIYDDFITKVEVTE